MLIFKILIISVYILLCINFLYIVINLEIIKDEIVKFKWIYFGVIMFKLYLKKMNKLYGKLYGMLF